jgi:hypothetical protein
LAKIDWAKPLCPKAINGVVSNSEKQELSVKIFLEQLICLGQDFIVNLKGSGFNIAQVS